MAEVDAVGGHGHLGPPGSSGADGIGAHLDAGMRAPAADSDVARQLVAMQTGVQVSLGAYTAAACTRRWSIGAVVLAPGWQSAMHVADSSPVQGVTQYFRKQGLQHIKDERLRCVYKHWL